MKFEKPIIEISMFTLENIVTESMLTSDTYVAAKRALREVQVEVSNILEYQY